MMAEKVEWPEENQSRDRIIGQNGNTGEHYPVVDEHEDPDDDGGEA